ncbi:helix-turn-helix domain-containing protein [Arthrobacter woluwensis]|uniref:helix-turn-helix domain-containing protein n=1 Tax=Arthrobacter woluwensis TaxID=156980 RepID=UPI0036F451B8
MERDTYMQAAASELRAAQGRAQRSDAALARLSGIPVVTLRRYLKGERDIPGSALFKLADALGTTPGALMDAAMKSLDSDDQ